MSVSAARLTSISRTPYDGEAVWATGGLYTYKALFAETGAYFACEVRAPAGYAIPVHSHDAEEEGFYVAAGEATIFLEDEARRLGAGSFAFAPRGVRHAFRLESAEARLLLLVSPGPEHERLFRELGIAAPERVVPPPAGPPDVALLGEIAARHGTRIVGPPPLETTDGR